MIKRMLIWWELNWSRNILMILCKNYGILLGGLMGKKLGMFKMEWKEIRNWGDKRIGNFLGWCSFRKRRSSRRGSWRGSCLLCWGRRRLSWGCIIRVLILLVGVSRWILLWTCRSTRYRWRAVCSNNHRTLVILIDSYIL